MNENNVHYCTNCGEKLDGKERFCPSCGKEFEKEKVTGNTDTLRDKRESMRGHKTFKKWLIGLVTAVIFLLIFVAVVFSGESETEKTNREFIDIFSKAYLLPEEFGREKTVTEALKELCGEEKIYYLKRSDDVADVTYQAKTMWLEKEAEIKLKLEFNLTDNSVKPVGMTMDNVEMDLRFMDAFLLKCEGYDKLSEEVLQQWADGQSSSYFGEMKIDRADAEAEAQKMDEDFMKTLDETEVASLHGSIGTVEINEADSNDAGDTVNGPHVMLPDSSTRNLTDTDVSGMTTEQLRIAINEIYARHGRRFKDTGLQTWFDAQEWYQGTVAPDDFRESVLSQIEKDNIKLLQKKKDGGAPSSVPKEMSGRYETRFGDEGGAELEIMYATGPASDIYAAAFEGSWMDSAGDTTGYLEAKTDGTDGAWYYYTDGINEPAMQIQYDGYDSITVTTLDGGNFGGMRFPGFGGTYHRTEEYPMP